MKHKSSSKPKVKSTISSSLKSSIPKIKKIQQSTSSKKGIDIYDEDTNYQVESTSKLNTEERNQIPHPPNSYVERLEQKIQEQAKRLSDLTNYKYLCEKRIVQLNPNENFPITEQNLISNVEQKTDTYTILYEKYNKLLKEHNELLKNQRNETICSNSINNNGSSVNSTEYNEQEFRKLKHKNKELKNENNKVIELLRQETINSEEQKNLIAILQQTIDNDLLKTGAINKYITSENVVDFSKLKNENDNYRKQLVLSQALVNSLKAEIEQLNAEKENNHKIENNNSNSNVNSSVISIKKDNDNLISENIQLKTTISSQNQMISNLNSQIVNLKSLIDEAENKINQNVERNNEIDNKIKNYESEIEERTKEVKEYETKFGYFNDYISNMKLSLSKLQSVINNYINMYHKMANEDLNSLISKTFSEQIVKLQNSFSNIKKIEKYSLDVNDTNLHSAITNLLKIVNNEFILIYERVFDSINCIKDSSMKLEQFESEIKKYKETIAVQTNKINELNQKISFNEKEKEKLNIIIGECKQKEMIYQEEKDEIKRKYLILKNEKDNLIHISQILIRISNGGNSYGKLYQEGITICETITKLEDEKSHIKEKIESLTEVNQSNIELYNMVQNQHSTLVNLYNEFERKITEKQNRLEQIKKELSDFGIISNRGNSLLSNTTANKLSNRMEINTLDSNVFSSRTNDNCEKLTEYDFDENKEIIENYLPNEQNYSSNGIKMIKKQNEEIAMNDLISSERNNGNTITLGENINNKLTYELSDKVRNSIHSN